MKKIVTLIFLLQILNVSLAQTKFKDNKNIYLLDITLSMFGYNGAPDIFDDVRKELITSIESISNPNTEIVVVTFQDKIVNTWTAYATKEGKSNVIHHLNRIDEEQLKPTFTNIYSAWKKGCELVDPEKLNVIYLLTDGVQNTSNPSKTKLYDEIRSWGKFSHEKDYYAFLVELVENAKDEELRKVVKETSNAQIISGIEFFVFSIKNDKPIVNINDGLVFNLDFIGDRLSEIPEKFVCSLNLESPYFDLNKAEYYLSERPFEIKLVAKQNINTLQANLEPISNYKIKILFETDKYPNVKLLNNNINLQVNNKKEMVLKIKVLDN